MVVGWARRLHPRRIIVVDDDVAADPNEQSIYRTGLPEALRADFWSEREAVVQLPAVAESGEPAFVLTADLHTMARLARHGMPIAEINVGCLHRAAGRRPVLPYVCLDATDEELIEEPRTGSAGRRLRRAHGCPGPTRGSGTIMTECKRGCLSSWEPSFLDQWPALQAMISRPIVIGPVVGAILGAPAEGVLWGAALEAMALAVLRWEPRATRMLHWPVSSGRPPP